MVFASYSDALVPGDSNGSRDVFVKDLYTGKIALVSRSDGPGTRAAAGGFARGAELVVFTSNVASLTASNAAAAIGSATSAYATGATALFAVDNGSDTGLHLFTSSGANATVSASELTLLATLTGTASTVVGDYAFGA